ncbi:isopentenyl-diphosphate Delta-isomerase [Balamuthia mandrillaris]
MDENAESCEDPKEVFEIFDEENRLVGKEYRGKVHKLGLLHRSVNVLLISDKGELLLQKRSSRKLICPSCWDLSVSEHLQPGETFQAAVLRGLKEELHLDVAASLDADKDIKRIRAAHLCRTDYPQQGLKDYEWNECWAVRLAIGNDEHLLEVQVDQEEVSEAKWVPLPEVTRMVRVHRSRNNNLCKHNNEDDDSRQRIVEWRSRDDDHEEEVVWRLDNHEEEEEVIRLTPWFLSEWGFLVRQLGKTNPNHPTEEDSPLSWFSPVSACQ